MSDGPLNEETIGQDVFVPWKLTEQPGCRFVVFKKNRLSKCSDVCTRNSDETNKHETAVYNRYYHMFQRGELRNLVLCAASELGIEERRRNQIEEKTDGSHTFIEIVQDGWERSNYYVELRLWKG